MQLTEAVEELSKERFFKNSNGKEVSSFLKSLRNAQLSYFVNSLNESSHNICSRDHQRIIALSCLLSAPLVVSSKGYFRHILSSNHCNYDANLEYYITCFGDEISLEDEKERTNILKNLLGIEETRIIYREELETKLRVRLSKQQGKQIRDLVDSKDHLTSYVYRNLISPLFGYFRV